MNNGTKVTQVSFDVWHKEINQCPLILLFRVALYMQNNVVENDQGQYLSHGCKRKYGISDHRATGDIC